MGPKSLSDIKFLRKKFSLNQNELAGKAGVSQSLIAKIEAGKVEPTFSKAQQIFSALEELREKEEVKAKEVMNKEILTTPIHSSLKEIISIMKENGISQVPVVSRENVCGLVTEKILLKETLNNPDRINSLRAGDVMEEAPPIISLNTGIRILSELLHDYPIVLVAEKGEMKGVVSKSDLLGRVE